MRFLNKIIFIESAKVRYAEVAIDGNVHFIGTQGVGKSTALRAILFFYNADKMKLGIEKSKDSFDEYYFPKGNSSIIYEVMRETGPYCILAYRSQGRACFRFLDGPYKMENFIDENRIPREWDGIRNSLVRNGHHYSRKIDRYEEYRDILYGNNRGLDSELRKFALIESRQYQNIPRTIQNVFLNSKLDAEFIKQTIIMSLNEEDVKIPLDNYMLHLRDFDTQLADINKWTEKNKAGEIPVRKQAEKIARLHAEIRILNQEKQGVAVQLFQNYDAEQKDLPELEKQAVIEDGKSQILLKRDKDLYARFEIKKEEIQKFINNLESDLKKAKRKADEYEIMNISGIIQRVAKKQDAEQEQKRLLEEKELLSSKFREINSRYDALILQQQNAFAGFENETETSKIALQASLLQFKNDINDQYKELFDEIRKQNKAALETARDTVGQKKEVIQELKLQKQKAQLERYFEKETEAVNLEINKLKQQIKTANVDIADFQKQVETFQKQWELDTKTNEISFETKAEKIIRETEKFTKSIAAIETKLVQNQDSLYSWLTEYIPGWELTIGKVIDEEQVLFHAGLSPQLVPGNDTLFGIKLDLEEINKTVKTVADYEQEKLQFQKNTEVNNISLNALHEQKKEDSDKLKRKYQPKIKDLKDAGFQAEYLLQKSKEDLQENEVNLAELIKKAATEKANTIFKIEQDLVIADEELLKGQQHYASIETVVQKQIENKEKEQKKKIIAEEQLAIAHISELVTELAVKKAQIDQRIVELKQQQNDDLKRDGADTERISEIDNALDKVKNELNFIEDNRDKVAEYNKDKRELFDHVERFKADKKLRESQLETEKEKHEFQRKKLKLEIDLSNNVIIELSKRVSTAKEGLKAFEEFKLTESYSEISVYNVVQQKIAKERQALKGLIDLVNAKIYSLQGRFSNLQAAVNAFLGNFSFNNIFDFKTSLSEREEFIAFAEMLYEFLEEDKIAQYEKRVNERFATLIRQIGKETTELVSKEGEIQKVITDINGDFEERNFAGVIKSIKLRLSGSQNRIVTLLLAIKSFNDEHALSLGAANLFSTVDSDLQNKKAITLLKEFAREIINRKEKEISLSDSFELQFRIVENDNDSGWVEKLANVGSEGTDILVKAMINIMLLNVFKDNASRKFKDFRLHCMMDEIGKLHPNNVKGILKFANDRNILLINSSPTSYNASDYRYTYLLSKDSRSITNIKRLIKKGTDL
ncbi:ATP-binding protein [Dyadobacter frigoris]|uniref:ATP-binding protein n=1 Tax=Dyadobacter frigoris TaxID=2576211 RepID=A0A4U6CQ76_9BACT|nr:ATP-binding protein [Dyadobacter frigoris]TKT86639.1 ATP-binding protein [Dyadobacter frigoris]GLU56811.1 ATP-binding protein [Dyadobacter frigoris]